MPESGIVLLGKQYSFEEEDKFVQGITSLVSLTYRKDFPALEDDLRPAARTGLLRFIRKYCGFHRLPSHFS